MDLNKIWFGVSRSCNINIQLDDMDEADLSIWIIFIGIKELVIKAKDYMRGFARLNGLCCRRTIRSDTRKGDQCENTNDRVLSILKFDENKKPEENVN
ncbi:42258_t:CDS:2 [Gigaspora margarita]|uniref:42258_t:CDS:1 n=1 Tax=Gigaspora margarita TaxID=4874 RepID=A0ABM8W6I1_GIGMA|nr:42258_t:CDS:2 [Gigaspora margarita]